MALTVKGDHAVPYEDEPKLMNFKDRVAVEANGVVASKNRVPRADVFLYAFSDELVPALIGIEDALVHAGIRVEMNVSDWKPKRALQFASKLGFPFAILVGKKEHEDDKVTLKNLQTEEQATLALDAAITVIKGK